MILAFITGFTIPFTDQKLMEHQYHLGKVLKFLIEALLHKSVSVPDPPDMSFVFHLRLHSV